jgi:thiol-disulfide isomerase/thioredoxin
MKPITLIPFAAFAALVTILVLVANYEKIDDGPPLTGWLEQFNVIDPPRPVPATPFEDASGREVTLGSFEGRVLLVNFWATWCAPCVREMPSLDRLQAKFEGEDFIVLAVDEDRKGTAVAKPFLDKLGLENLALYVDRRMALARALGVKGLPTTVLVDRRSRIVGRMDGVAEWDAPEVEALIRYYLR